MRLEIGDIIRVAIGETYQIYIPNPTSPTQFADFLNGAFVGKNLVTGGWVPFKRNGELFYDYGNQDVAEDFKIVSHEPAKVRRILNQ